jgi:hypothetical protein
LDGFGKPSYGIMLPPGYSLPQEAKEDEKREIAQLFGYFARG